MKRIGLAMFVDAILLKKQNGRPNVVLKKNGDFKRLYLLSDFVSLIFDLIQDSKS